jgi:hypothetical protein
MTRTWGRSFSERGIIAKASIFVNMIKEIAGFTQK